MTPRRVGGGVMGVALLWAGMALPSMAQLRECPGDANLDGDVTIAEVQRSANSYLYGCPAELPRFVDNGDGTVSDYQMGLTWEKKSDDGTIHDKNNTYTWSNSLLNDFDGTAATVFLANLNRGSGFAGHTDWRLPTRDELQSIVDYDDSEPVIVDAVFDTSCTPSCSVTSCSCTLSSNYWSSSTVGINFGYAWVAYFGNGTLSAGVKTTNYSVRAVRTGL